MRPTCRRASYTPEVFYEKYKLFSLCRYDRLGDVPPLDGQTDRLLWESGIDKITPRITVDNGNRSNYLMGEETLISVFTDGSDTVELFRDGELIKSYPVDQRAMIACKLERGYYVAKLKSVGEWVEFCVNRADISHNVKDGIITVCADPCDGKSKLLYADIRRAGTDVAALVKYEELSDEEKAGGKFSFKIPDKGENFKVYFENAFGIWTHPMTRII